MSRPFWCEAWPRPPYSLPKRPPLGREMSMIPTRCALSCSVRNSCSTRRTLRIRRSVPQRRHSRFGITSRIGSQVKKSSPSSGSSTPFFSRPFQAGEPSAFDLRHSIAPKSGGTPGMTAVAVGAGVSSGVTVAAGVGVGSGAGAGACAKATAAATSSAASASTTKRMRPIVASLLYVAGVVVFLHGVAGSRETYSWLPQSVAGHRVIRPDFRGHGAAARTPGAYRISDYVDDVIEVLRADGPAVLIGHSLGRRRRVDGGPGGAGTGPRRLPGGPAAVLGRARDANPAVPRFRELRSRTLDWQTAGVSEADAVAELAADPDGDAQTEDALAARAYSLLHLDPEVLDTVIDGSLLADTDVVAPVNVPVCVLAAGSEPAFGEVSEERLASTHPRVQVVRVAGAGHSIHDERAFRDEYFARVESFVASA